MENKLEQELLSDYRKAKKVTIYGTIIVTIILIGIVTLKIYLFRDLLGGLL